MCGPVIGSIPLRKRLFDRPSAPVFKKIVGAMEAQKAKGLSCESIEEDVVAVLTISLENPTTCFRNESTEGSQKQQGLRRDSESLFILIKWLTNPVSNLYEYSNLFQPTPTEKTEQFTLPATLQVAALAMPMTMSFTTSLPLRCSSISSPRIPFNSSGPDIWGTSTDRLRKSFG
jgi:hypothetical protein